MKPWERPKNERTSLVHHLYITCTSSVHHLYILNNTITLLILYNTPNWGRWELQKQYPPMKRYKSLKYSLILPLYGSNEKVLSIRPTPCRGRESMQVVFIQYAQAH